MRAWNVLLWLLVAPTTRDANVVDEILSRVSSCNNICLAHVTGRQIAPQALNRAVL